MVSLEKHEYDLNQPNTDARVKGNHRKTVFAIALKYKTCLTGSGCLCMGLCH